MPEALAQAARARRPRQESAPDDPAASQRRAVLEGIAVAEHRMGLAGTSTAVLVGGDGPPMVLLHGPGESSLWWARCLPELLRSHRVIVPDMPGHGASGTPAGTDAADWLAWLDAVVERLCDAPPVLVGHVVGGALAARYAARHPERVAALLLVDTLGLRRFRPSPAFGYRLLRFMSKPSRATYGPFLEQCMVDAAGLARGMEDRWGPFVEYALANSRRAEHKAATKAIMKHYGMPRITREELASIAVPTGLVWGRSDKATPVKVAQDAGARYGWPLRIVAGSGDDPKLERPAEFVAAVEELLQRLHPANATMTADRRA